MFLASGVCSLELAAKQAATEVHIMLKEALDCFKVLPKCLQITRILPAHLLQNVKKNFVLAQDRQPVFTTHSYFVSATFAFENFIDEGNCSQWDTI